MEPITLIKKLSNISSRVAKAKLMVEHGDELFKKILTYAYDPSKKYHIIAIPYHTRGFKTICEIQEPMFKMLDALSTRQLSGHAAKIEVANMLSSLTTANANVLCGILRKDLRCGIKEAIINMAYPGLIMSFKVMLAKLWDDSMYTKGLLMSLKYDGIRAIFSDGDLYSRNGIKLTGLSHIVEPLRRAYGSMILDGEILVPNMTFQASSGLIRNGHDVPEAIYHIFDTAPTEGTIGLPFLQRLDLLRINFGKVDTPNIALVKHIPARSLEHIYATFSKALQAGYEGLVIKPESHLYVRVRSKNWLKIKAVNTADLPITGYFEGEGKYDGMLGGFIVYHEGMQVRVGSGYSDNERALFWAKRESYIGRTMEVKYHEVTPDNSLRHPVFMGMRWDK
jgi:DNA ligase-1